MRLCMYQKSFVYLHFSGFFKREHRASSFQIVVVLVVVFAEKGSKLCQFVWVFVSKQSSIALEELVLLIAIQLSNFSNFKQQEV